MVRRVAAAGRVRFEVSPEFDLCGCGRAEWYCTVYEMEGILIFVES